MNLYTKKTIIDYFIKNIKDKNIVNVTCKKLELDKKSTFWYSRYNFLKDFRKYVLKNWMDQKAQYIIPSIPYNF